ncbi:MAG: phosphoenolpyruvate--protein phosphotransferase, partial [Candidatus Omnitrophica bacterium]|nr:phosphoenolpyruvate--protein phosphotransferase [Candidatus Omnitrophota bacterium]
AAYRERNPFLGCRSIRLSLQYPTEFKKQLRAILRASVHGNVRIMYPLISSSREIVLANGLLEEAKRELEQQGVPFQHDIPVGAMIEVPSAALTADTIARYVSFFSLGTNDLIQYTMAVDRVNEKVSYLYQPCNPAVVKLITMTVEAARRADIEVSVCGETASIPETAVLFVGLGIKKLSMAPALIPQIKQAIRKIPFGMAKDIAEKVTSFSTHEDIFEFLKKSIKRV